MGFLRSRSPDAIIVLLDRSASMDLRDVEGRSLLDKALDHIESVPAEFVRGSRKVFIESVFLEPRELAGFNSIRDMDWAQPTHTAANWTAMLESALSWIEQNQPGRTEIWMFSDGQSSNWTPESRTWQSINRRLAEIEPSVSAFALFAETGQRPPNISVRARSAVPHPDGGYELAFTVSADSPPHAAVEALFITDGAQTMLPLEMPSETVDFVRRVPDSASGWAGVVLPADSNPSDNEAWFVFGPAPEGRIWVYAENSTVGDRVRNAFRPRDARDPHPVRNWPRTGEPPLDDAALIVWQGAPPEGSAGETLAGFIHRGGVVLALPPEQQDQLGEGSLWSWGEPLNSKPGTLRRITDWDRFTGPFAQTAESNQLPLGEIGIAAQSDFSHSFDSDIYAVARLDDTNPILSRSGWGSGNLYAIGTLPISEWSDIWDGRIWVPALWRMRAEGGRRIGDMLNAVCGSWMPESDGQPWETLLSDDTRNPRTHSGVYRLGRRLLALNRPEAEDRLETIEPDRMLTLLPELDLRVVQGTEWGAEGPSEASLFFLALAAAMFLSEAALAASLHKGGRTVKGKGVRS